MKAVIFSCSIKDGKNSDTQAWSELFAKSMNAQGIQTEIINLKKFDYEASTGPDLLHEEMAKWNGRLQQLMEKERASSN